MAAPVTARNMVNAPKVVDPRTRGGGKQAGETSNDIPQGERTDPDRIDPNAVDSDDEGEGDEGEYTPMTDAALLSMLKLQEDDAAEYATGPLRASRDSSIKAYFQRPYGNEDEGWSDYVSAVVSETVEWMAQDLLDLFASNPKAVTFEPTRADQEKKAKDATAGVNHVFYQQNNGFLILHTAIKDMLTVKTCAIHWFGQTKRRRIRVPFRNASIMDMTMLEQKYPNAKVDEAIQSMGPVTGPDGRPIMNPMTGKPHMQPVFTGKLSYVEQRKSVKIEAFEPENLGVMRSWTSPLLEDCPYVVRWVEISLSDLNMLADDMGFDRVAATDLAASLVPFGAFDDQYRRDRTGNQILADSRPRPEGIVRDDPSQTMGWLRIEYVLVDFDGDGIAERREVWRLHSKILLNEECDSVPICTGSPIPIPHRWDGQSVAETMEDLQLLDTELTRGVINNAFASNNPRKLVLTDKNGAPYADMGDLVDGRPGGNIRVTQIGAVSMEPTLYVGHQMEPLLQRVDQLREQRSGVTKQRMGMDPNALHPDVTLGDRMMQDQASKQRTKLIGRIFGETVLKPCFNGVKRLLSSGDFDQLFFKLRGEYVTLDPSDWCEEFDMVCNVGLGTGDEEKQVAVLKDIRQTQIQMAQSPLAKMVTPHQIYSSTARLVELGGYKNVGEFFSEPPPDAQMPQQPPPPPPWQLQAKDMELKAKQQAEQADRAFQMAKLDLEARNKAQAAADQNNIQLQNDQRDAMREARDADSKDQLEALQLLLDKYKADLSAETSLMIARIGSERTEDPAGLAIDPKTGQPMQNDGGALQPVLDALQKLYDLHSAPAEPVTVHRDPATGDITGVQKGAGPVRPVVRDPASGRVTGVQ
jgi:hypothetical protein